MTKISFGSSKDRNVDAGPLGIQRYTSIEEAKNGMIDLEQMFNEGSISDELKEQINNINSKSIIIDSRDVTPFYMIAVNLGRSTNPTHTVFRSYVAVKCKTDYETCLTAVTENLGKIENIPFDVISQNKKFSLFGLQPGYTMQIQYTYFNENKKRRQQQITNNTEKQQYIVCNLNLVDIIYELTIMKKEKKEKSKIPIIIGTISLFLILIFVFIYFYRKRQQPNQQVRPTTLYSQQKRQQLRPTTQYSQQKSQQQKRRQNTPVQNINPNRNLNSLNIQNPNRNLNSLNIQNPNRNLNP